MAVDEVHPDLRNIARWLPHGGIGAKTLKPIRLLTGLQSRSASKSVEVTPVGAVSVRLHRPSPSPSTSPSSPKSVPAMLWIHGGGMVMGTAVQDDAICRRFARDLGILVAAVDYRLAPEHPFPVPLDDCYDALLWLAQQPGVDPSRIVVGGASAGGGLAAGLALLARRRGEVHLAFQLLTYPMLDDRTATLVDRDAGKRRLWSNASNLFGWQSYLGHAPGGSDVDELAAPARAGDLTELPPAWIGVGTLDLFYEEDVAYAERLRAAGVTCALDVVQGAFHGFDAIRPKAAVSEAFRTAQIAALAAALG